MWVAKSLGHAQVYSGTAPAGTGQQSGLLTGLYKGTRGVCILNPSLTLSLGFYYYCGNNWTAANFSYQEWQRDAAQ